MRRPPTIYLDSAKNRIAGQDPFPQPTQVEATPVNPPYSRSHYQLVYSEKGKSLFEVTSFSDVFAYIVQAADGTQQVLINLQTHLHYEFSAAPLTPSRVDPPRFHPGKCHRSWEDGKVVRLLVCGAAGGKPAGGTDEAKWPAFVLCGRYPCGILVLRKFHESN